jgi:anaerobic ribonucleoside-triphosphate reductase activating protein
MRCDECMTPGALSFDGGTVISVADLADEVLSTRGIEGLTITGGEPFAQAGALAALLQILRARADLGVVVYTGYRLHQLRRWAESDASIRNLLEGIDLLVDGPYVPSRNDNGALRGSDNQRVVLLTERYARVHSLHFSAQGRAIELFVGADHCMLVGIPSAAHLRWWRNRQSHHRPLPRYPVWKGAEGSRSSWDGGPSP